MIKTYGLSFKCQQTSFPGCKGASSVHLRAYPLIKSCILKINHGRQKKRNPPDWSQKCVVPPWAYRSCQFFEFHFCVLGLRPLIYFQNLLFFLLFQDFFGQLLLNRLMVWLVLDHLFFLWKWLAFVLVVEAVSKAYHKNRCLGGVNRIAQLKLDARSPPSPPKKDCIRFSLSWKSWKKIYERDEGRVPKIGQNKVLHRQVQLNLLQADLPAALWADHRIQRSELSLAIACLTSPADFL